MLKIVTLIALALAAAALAFAVWQLVVVADSLSGLWLIFWAMIFGPIFLAIAAAHLWRAFRNRNPRRMEA
jgi:hypothetical protein